MKRVKVQVTSEVDAIEVFGVTFVRKVNGDSYTKGEITLTDRTGGVTSDDGKYWTIEFPGGAFRAKTPEKCLQALAELWALLGNVVTQEMLPVAEPEPVDPNATEPGV